MIINGEWKENITCPRCRFRHPKDLSCHESKIEAYRNKPVNVLDKVVLSYNDLEQQRDQLLEALKEIASKYVSCEATQAGTLAYIAKDAINKIEATK